VNFLLTVKQKQKRKLATGDINTGRISESGGRKYLQHLEPTSIPFLRIYNTIPPQFKPISPQDR
jgi:hypothetical protein